MSILTFVFLVSHPYVHYGVIGTVIILAVSWLYLGIRVCLHHHQHFVIPGQSCSVLVVCLMHARIQVNLATKALWLVQSIVDNPIVKWLWNYLPFNEMLAVTAEPVGELPSGVT